MTGATILANGSRNADPRISTSSFSLQDNGLTLDTVFLDTVVWRRREGLPDSVCNRIQAPGS